MPSEKRKKYARKYYLDNKERCHSHRKAWYQRNRHKKKAKDAVYRAILNGTLMKPKTCGLCLNTSVQAHHEDYSKPLDVVWLCPRHHGAYHRLKRFMAKEEIDLATLRLFI